MISRRKWKHRHQPLSALELLRAHLETPDEAAWYAEQLERLGRIMFGDLWDDKPLRPNETTPESSRSWSSRGDDRTPQRGVPTSASRRRCGEK